MITPLDQRQMFQTVTVEAAKAAHETSGQHLRDAALRQALVERMAQDQSSVPQIPRAESLRAEEREARRQGQERKHDSGEGGAREPASGSAEAKAIPADGRLDILA